MPYGTIKVDTITFTDGGVDKSVAISGLVQNPTFTGNVTVTGTVSGATVRATTVSGVTISGTTVNAASGVFTTQISGAVVVAPAGLVGTPSVQVGTGATVAPGLYGAGTDQLGISTAGSSRLVVDSVGQIRVVTLGSATAPALVVGNDLNTGLYSLGADQVAISTAGTGRLFVGSDGKVGIGTSSPGALADIRSTTSPSVHISTLGYTPDYRGYTLDFSTSQQTAGINFSTSSPSTFLDLYAGGSATNLGDWDGQIRFFTGGINSYGTERLRITSDGRLGIGTSSPNNTLHVAGTGSTQALFERTGSNGAFIGLKDGSANNVFLGNTNGVFSIQTPGSSFSDKLVVTSAGLVGIGTSSPGALLDLAGGAIRLNSTHGIYKANADGYAYFSGGTGLTAGGTIFCFGESHAGNANEIHFRNSSNLTRAVIDSSGRLGIGTNNPQSLLHLETDGTALRIVRGSSIGFVYNTGTASTSPFRIQSNSGSVDLYSAAGQPITFSAGGTEKAQVDSSGRLLIGTTNQDVGGTVTGIKLAPEGQVFASSDTATLGLNNPFYGDRRNTAGDGPVYVLARHGYYKAAIGCTNGGGIANEGALTFYTGTNSGFNERLRITGNGALGLGTSSPNRLFESSAAGVDNFIRVNTTGATKSGIEFASGGTVYSQLYFNNVAPYDLSLLQQYSTGSLILGTNNTERLRIDSSGRLLVGTSSHSNNGRLVVQGNTDDGLAAALDIKRGDASPASGSLIGTIRFQDTTSSTYYGLISCETDAATGAADKPGRLVFSTTADGASSPTERMRINQSGTIGSFATSLDANIYLSNAATAGVSTPLLRGRYGATGMYGGTDSIYIWSNGNVQNTNNSYTAISDAKLKENIVDANSQWNDIKALQVRNYNLKEGQTHKQIGLIAQEVEPISPGLVYESPDRDAEGNDLGTVTKSVNYSVLYMKAVKALQEAMERIEQLEAKVAALESA